MSKLKSGLELIKFDSTTERLLAWRKCVQSIVSGGDEPWSPVSRNFHGESPWDRENPAAVLKKGLLLRFTETIADLPPGASRSEFPAGLPANYPSIEVRRAIVPGLSSGNIDKQTPHDKLIVN